MNMSAAPRSGSAWYSHAHDLASVVSGEPKVGINFLHLDVEQGPYRWDHPQLHNLPVSLHLYCEYLVQHQAKTGERG